ncbi:hypothetical protein EAH89_14600 [Roseomonas nepalensis]|uniref:Uncharacterized protein n=2 Tax=Muricoccus nepalensis TaxID=1854500 RepID=A0A502G0V3_9PROT|nr:hypothetical protein EAH89_14600 [Roseomonas nepalensis]
MDAARVILDLAKGRCLVADQPSWDGPWLDLLLATVGAARYRVSDFDAICWDETARLIVGEPRPTLGMSMQHARLACYCERERAMALYPEVRHRAGPDARRIRAGYEAVCRAVNQRLNATS